MYPPYPYQRLFSTPEQEVTYPGLPSPLPVKSSQIPVVAAKTPASNAISGTINPFHGILMDQMQASEEELAQQRRRLAVKAAMEGLGKVVGTFANVYGASKGAMVSPVKDNLQGIAQEASALDARKYNEQQRYNTLQLQQAMNEYAKAQDWNDFIRKMEVQKRAENDKDLRNFNQQKEIIGIQQDFTRQQYDKQKADSTRQDERNFEQQRELAKFNTDQNIRQIGASNASQFDLQKRLLEEGIKRDYSKDRPVLSIMGPQGEWGLNQAQFNDVLNKVFSDPKIQEEIASNGLDFDIKTKEGANRAVNYFADRFYEPTAEGSAKRKARYSPQEAQQKIFGIYNSKVTNDPQAKRYAIRQFLLENDPDGLAGANDEEINLIVDNLIKAMATPNYAAEYTKPPVK